MNGMSAELSERLTLTMGHFLWQGVVVAIVAALAAWAVRNSAAARYRVYLFAMLLMAACPAATFWRLAPAAPPAAHPAAPPVVAPATPAAPASEVMFVSAPVVEMPAPRAEFTRPAVPVAVSVEQPPSWRRYAPQLVTVYTFGAILMLVRVLLGLRGAKQLCRRSEPIDDPALLELVARQARRLGLTVAPRIRQCRDVVVPTVAGVIRPVILLPLSVLSGLSPEQVETIISHELAHIRRYDHIVQVFQRLIEAVLFFHPAVWFISRRLHVEREHCCDDMVVRAVGGSVTYARSLVRVAELCLEEQSRAVANMSLAALDRTASLRERVFRVLEGPVGTPRLRLGRVGLVTMIVAGTILSTTAWYRHSGASADESKPMTELAGVLTDTMGRTVSNAYITTEAKNPWYGVRSDTAGKFTLKNLTPDMKRGVAYSQRSRRMGLFNIPPTAPKDPLTVTLNYFEADVDGRVVDSSGNPVKGAWVRLFITTADGDIFRFETYSGTDASGYYGTGLVPAGQGLKVHATLSDNPSDDNRTEPVTLSQQYQVEMPDLVVRTATAPSPKPGPQRVRYSGKIVDEDGKPIEGVEIYLSYPKNSMVAGGGNVLTDADGRFSRLLPPDAERVSMRLNHPDFISFHFDDRVNPAISALRDGSAVITMKRGHTLEGIIRDDQDRPLSNALVQAGRLYSSSSGEIIEDGTSPRTDADGRFRAGGLPPGTREVSIMADGFAPKNLSVEIKPEGSTLDVRLDRGVSYSGRVVDADGNPVAGGYVRCDNWVTGNDRKELNREVETDADGRFTIDHLPTDGEIHFSADKRKGGFLGQGFKWSAGSSENPETVTMYKIPVVEGFVRDADTDQPITKFEVRPGWYWKEGDPFSESTFDGMLKVKDAADGKFSKKIQRIHLGAGGTTPVFAAKIVAPGYQPQVTPNVYLGKKHEPFVIKLKKAPWVAGVLKDPAGDAVVGAKVFLVEPHSVTYVEGLAVNDGFTHAPEIQTKTDKAGTFELPPSAMPGASRVLVLHENGYAIEPVDGLKDKSAVVKLVPWSRVQGDLVRDGAPVNGESLTLKMTPEKPYDPNGPREIEFTLKTATRADGRFEFERVPARPASIVRDTQFGGSGGVAVSPTPGQTVIAHLGDQRHAAVGKVDLSWVVPGSMKDVTAQVRVRAFRLDPPPVMPPTWKDPASWDAQVAEARKTEPAIMSPISQLCANIATPAADGTIRFNDLLPGHYVMYANVHAPPAPNICGWGPLLANARIEFQVLESSGKDATPLPDIPLTQKIYPGPGDPAPAMEAKTFAGEQFSLEKLRGKVVLIDFWASWCAPCMAAMPEMKALHEKYKADDRVVFVGGNFDWQPKKAEIAMENLKLPWTQVALGELGFENPLCRAYGISAIPSVWIIGADGRVIAKDLRGKEVADELEKALAK